MSISDYIVSLLDLFFSFFRLDLPIVVIPFFLLFLSFTFWLVFKLIKGDLW